MILYINYDIIFHMMALIQYTQRIPSRISKILVVFVTATDLAAAAAEATYLEAATAELQDRFQT